MTERPDPAAPLFVGGTGRSGTTIMGELLGARSELALIPIELRFHADDLGLVDLASGRIELPRFRARLLNRWFERPAAPNGPRGVHVVADLAWTRGCFRRLRSALDSGDDRWAACGTFMSELLDPWLRRSSAETWVEMTPTNAGAMPGLARLFPEAKFIHIYRDGRDVAASVARRSWGPDDVISALRWWGDRMVAIGEATRQTDQDRVLAVRLEALVGRDRSHVYDQLISFLARRPDPAMRSFFDARVSHDGARPGRWAHDLQGDQRRAVDLVYEEQLGRLAGYGFDLGDESAARGGA